MRRSIRIAAGPQTAKHARRIAGGPQAHHRFQQARQAANRRYVSENHQISWRIARPNAVVVVSAMYENVQTLPLPSMYGKNLTFKTGGMDATGLEEPLSLIEQEPIDTSCLISKRYALNDILEAYRAFEAREDGCLKVVITPWEKR